MFWQKRVHSAGDILKYILEKFVLRHFEIMKITCAQRSDDVIPPYWLQLEVVSSCSTSTQLSIFTVEFPDYLILSKQ